MDIGANIKRIREGKRLTQNDVAKAVGVTQGMIARIECGSKSPSILLASSIAGVLECTLNDFFKESA